MVKQIRTAETRNPNPTPNPSILGCLSFDKQQRGENVNKLKTFRCDVDLNAPHKYYIASSLSLVLDVPLVASGLKRNQ